MSAHIICITGSILGVGVAKNMHAVRWGVAGNIVTAWLLTIPANIILSGTIYYIITLFV